MATTDAERWPVDPIADWQDTRDTLHLYAQVVSKLRLANEPRRNHFIFMNGGPGTVQAPRALEAFGEFAEK